MASSSEGLRGADALFAGPGDARQRCRAVDWSATPLGPVEAWPGALRAAVRLAMSSRTPIAIWAGPEFTLVPNDAYSVVLGGKAGWAAGRPGREVWAEVWDRIEPEFQRVARSGDSARHEDTPYRIVRSGVEEEAFFTYTLSPIEDDEGRIVGVLNVTEETTPAVRALTRTEEKYRSLFDSIDEGFCIIEVLFEGERPVDYRLLEVNPAFEHQTGLVGSVGRRVRELVPDPEEHWLEVYGRVALTGEATRLELPSRRLGRHYDVYAFRVGAAEQRRVAVLFSDVTQRRRAEEALRASEARLSAVLDQLPVAAGVVDQSGRFVLGNSALRSFGLDRIPSRVPEQRKRWYCEDAEGNPLPPEEWPAARALRGEPVNPGLEFVYTDEGGSQRWTVVAAVPLREPAGEVSGALVVVQDVTALKLAEQALRLADRRKSEFLGVLSHELRNPLAPIRNSIYLLERAPPDSAPARHAKEVIRRQTDHLTRLVDDLLDVTRISRGKIELKRARIDLRDVVRRSNDDLRSIFDESGVELRVEYDTGPAWVDGDATRLSQVFGNLLQNAVKFTPAGGTVTVALSVGEGRVAVAVRDTGSGMDPREVDRMFEPFAQADQTLARTKGGLGLGLALVKGLVELHGGGVRGSSAGIGRGAEFVVSLPLAAAPAPGIAAGLGVRGASRRVLIVEDNVDAARSLAEILELAGHRVSVAFAARAGLDLAREARPDVVICDIGLPGMDGYEFARTVRRDESLRGIRLIALTGYAQPEDRQRALEAGFDAHEAKPASLDRLAALLAE